MTGKELTEAMTPIMMTHRQLAQLMASGQYEWKHEPSNSGIVYTTYKYFEKEADTELSVNEQGQKILIRRFTDIEWAEPTFRAFKDFENHYSLRALLDDLGKDCNDYAVSLVGHENGAFWV